MIGDYYLKHEILDNTNRNNLAKLIIETEYNLYQGDKKSFSLSKERLIQLVEEIKHYFKNEPEMIYYIAYNPITKRLPTGKLFNYYIAFKNKMKLTKASKKGSARSRKKPLKDVEKSPPPIIKTGEKINLQYYANWSNTSETRIDKLKQSLMTTEQYLNLYSVLKEPDGYKYIVQDFDFLFPESPNFEYEFRKISKKICDIGKSRERARDDIIRCVDKNLEALFWLTFLLQPISSRKKDGSRSKCSKVEARKAFINYFEVICSHLTISNPKTFLFRTTLL